METIEALGEALNKFTVKLTKHVFAEKNRAYLVFN
jgi:hypothetical protein